MLALALLAGALLAACGSSSKTTSTNTAAAADSPSTTATAPSTVPSAPAKTSTSKTGSTPAKTPAPSKKAPSTPLRAGARFTALRECLAKQGVKLPQGSVGATLPAGVSRAQFEAAFKNCRGGRAGLLARGTSGYSAAFKKELANFAACMRQNGVNMPAPNTSGKGPVFDTSRLDTTSPAFRAATQKCASHLRVAKPGTK
jgi:hypothetical protein